MMQYKNDENITNAKQHTGNIGLFYACYRLAMLGWNVLPTIRNAKGADIILVRGKYKIGIQVKTLSSEADIPLGNNYNDSSVDFWIIIMNIRNKDKIKIFVIPQIDILEGVKICENGINSSSNLIYHDKPKSDGKINYWINKKFLLKSECVYNDNWNIIK